MKYFIVALLVLFSACEDSEAEMRDVIGLEATARLSQEMGGAADCWVYDAYATNEGVWKGVLQCEAAGAKANMTFSAQRLGTREYLWMIHEDSVRIHPK